MFFTLHEVKSIAHDVAREYPALEIVAVTPGEGGVASAELLVATTTARMCLVSIHVSRDGTSDELRASIVHGLRRHFGPAPEPHQPAVA